MVGTDCQAVWRAFRDIPRTKIAGEDWQGKAWHLHTWTSSLELEQMPGHLWRAGCGHKVCLEFSNRDLYIDGDPAKRPAQPRRTKRNVPEELRPSTFEKLGANLLPPAETRKDTKRPDESMFIGMPGESAGTLNPHARLEFKWTLDEGLIHPTTRCTLVHRDDTSRAWGMGQGIVPADKIMADLRRASSSDSRRSILRDFVQTLNEKGEPPNSELSLFALVLPAAAAEFDFSSFEHDADPAVLQAAQVLVFLL